MRMATPSPTSSIAPAMQGMSPASRMVSGVITLMASYGSHTPIGQIVSITSWCSWPLKDDRNQVQHDDRWQELSRKERLKAQIWGTLLLQCFTTNLVLNSGQTTQTTQTYNILVIQFTRQIVDYYCFIIHSSDCSTKITVLQNILIYT